MLDEGILVGGGELPLLALHDLLLGLIVELRPDGVQILR